MSDKFGAEPTQGETSLPNLGNTRKRKKPSYVVPPPIEEGVRPAPHEPGPATGTNGHIDEAGLEAALASDDNAAPEPDAEPTEEQEQQEELSGYIDLPLLDNVISDNIVKLCSACCSPGEEIEHQWVMADTPDKSIRIQLRRKAGRWVNHAASPDEQKSKGGNFTQLLMFLYQWTFPQAVTKIGLVLGIRLIQPWEDYVLGQNVFYESGNGNYWIPGPRDSWIRVIESGAKRFLQEKGIATKKPQDGLMSPMDRALLTLNRHMNVAYAGPLCGFISGERIVHGERVLVTSSLRLVKPAKGEFPKIGAILSGLFGPDQLIYFLSWCHVAYETLYNGERRPGQAIALLGPRDSGKSFLIDQIIVPCLGNRVAEPYQFLSGKSEHNGDMFTAEVLKIDDQTAFTDIASRRAFGIAIKRITGNDESACHAKYKQRVVLPVFWRLVIAANDEDENLMILPPIDVSIEDKIMLFRCEKNSMPMPTRTLEERKALEQTVREELPFFCQYLLEWQIPSKLVEGRFGVKQFHHPQVIEVLRRLSPEHRLLELIAGCLFPTPATGPWEGSLLEFEKQLKNIDSPMQYEAKKLLSFNNAAQTYMKRLRQRYPNLITNRHGMHGASGPLTQGLLKPFNPTSAMTWMTAMTAKIALLPKQKNPKKP